MNEVYNADIFLAVEPSPEMAGRQDLIIRWQITRILKNGLSIYRYSRRILEYPNIEHTAVASARSLLSAAIKMLKSRGIIPNQELENFIQFSNIDYDTMMVIEQMGITLSASIADFFRLYYWPKPIKLQTELVPWPLPPGARVIHRCDVVIPYSLANFRWVTQSVESILNQSYVDCVIHLIQDGPLECTPENQHLHREIELLCGLPQVRWYRNEESVGPYISVHRVWGCMETEFLAIQDSDDVALPNRLWYSIETLRMTGGDIFGAAMEQFLSHEAESEAMVKRLAAQPVLAVDFPDVVNGTMVCRRAAFERINGFLPLKCAADSELPKRMYRAGLGVVLVPHVVALRRLHSASLCFGSDYKLGSSSRNEAWAHIKRVYEQYDEPGVDYAKFGGLERDRDNPATIRLNKIRLVEAAADKITIRNLEYHVSQACNMRCVSCSHYSNHNHKGHISPEEADQEFSLWSGRLRPRWVSLLGGEPTLNPALCEIVEIAARHWTESSVRLVTNGWFLDRHPNLPAVLEKTNCHLEISIHGMDPVYMAKLAEIRFLIDTWQKNHTIKVNWRSSFATWTKRYHDTPDGIEPFDDSNPDLSWEICRAKWCPQLFRGQIWKCPQIAYLSLELERATEVVRARWEHYQDYQSLPSSSNQDTARRFLRRRVEAICAMCPARALSCECFPLALSTAQREP